MVLDSNMFCVCKVELILMTLAGIDLFQTDYALEMALEGKAIVFNSKLGDT